ncbi:hypothetical protein ESY86_09010 [Subsaximicrobium wynnwilliamsii]|jgi:peroxiredoxin|uniref:Uncharacterized protein n=1 Tax=Subsaximicrobium wynnwilliamsii TaxID=291179 RepID=A0A5C6ZHH6_9FLAO|nr:hypothetical protein [Subsaximicrobium wynnwilliamsii]TXD83537.1 hypothetical protein ESY87_09800 [Subsaximicrobium wynnwilliamsii]TXD89188.1 hypothetical protein ESY86_09010 [Subsaximicrobium wynnwilliamsii]TXE03217.1 hypothetical protein ESY88_09510 [Subsaximicrobium wynnwilliamsii]
MKTKSIAIVSLLVLCFFTLTSLRSATQETMTFEGTYDGHEDYGYNFIGTDTDDNEYTMTFQDIDAKLLSNFDLKSEALVGKKFTVTYTIESEVVTDEDGYDEETETYSIVNLKQN